MKYEVFDFRNSTFFYFEWHYRVFTASIYSDNILCILYNFRCNLDYNYLRFFYFYKKDHIGYKKFSNLLRMSLIYFNFRS